jgi:hypothetical protein
MTTENDWLTRARQAAKQGSAAASHLYYCTYLAQNPADGKIFAEFLEVCRTLPRANRAIGDIIAQGAFGKLLPSQAPQKIYAASLEKLKFTPYDLDSIYKILKAAQSAGWHSLAIACCKDILRHSAAAKAPSKLYREIKTALGQAHYHAAEYQPALDALKEFESDPAAGKDVLQMLKDSAANLAAAVFEKNDTSHRIATAESISLATQTPQDKAVQEQNDLLVQLNDPRSEPAKVCAAALKLADHFLRAQAFENALDVIAKARDRIGANGDLAKKAVEIHVRKLDCEIEREKLARLDPQLYERLLIEREQYLVHAYTDLAASLPTDGDVHLRLGEALFSQWNRSHEENTLKEAIAHLQFEFKTDEHAHRAQLLLAECFLALELPVAAESVLAAFLARLDSTRKSSDYFLDAHYLLGLVRERNHDTRGAISAYIAVIGRNIRFKDALDRVRRLESAAHNTLKAS